MMKSPSNDLEKFEFMNSFLPPFSMFPPTNYGPVGIIDSPPSVEHYPLLSNTSESLAAEVLRSVSTSNPLSPNQTNFTQTFLKSILASIDSKDPVVANAWLETLLDVIDLLPREVIKDEILSLAIIKGQSPQIESRLSACKLIGKISTKFEPFILKTEVLGVVQSLCQDVIGEVRGSMCSQLISVAKGVGLEETQNSILPDLVDLCSDEEVNVRLAGLNTVVQIIPLVDQETRMTALVPLVRKICERALKVQDVTLPIAAHLLGRICHGLHDDLSDDLKEWFINFFCTLATLGLPDANKQDICIPEFEFRNGEFEAECRQQCAYNMPAMIIFAGGPPTYRRYLHPTVVSLVTDPSIFVRNTIALSFHQLCTLVGNEVCLLREAFLSLLRSESVDVISSITPNISIILADFHHQQTLNQSQDHTEVLELVGALKQAEELLSGSSNWRVHSEVLRQMSALALCLPSDLLFSEVVPLIIQRMHNVRPIPCRLAAAKTILVYLRHMETIEHRDHICNTLAIEFCEGASCHKRMLFLNVCRTALELLPKNLFKNSFFHPFLSLYVDPVANIRLNVVKLLPQVKATLVIPEDQTKLQELETAVGNLLLDEQDQDVMNALSNVINQLDKIETYQSERLSPEGQEFDQLTSTYSKEDKKEKGGLSLPLRNVNGTNNARRSKMPSYVERRKSTNFAPEVPPDETSLLRLSNLDPSTDEFFVDAGIRIDESLFHSRIPAPANLPRTSRMKLPAPSVNQMAQSRMRPPNVMSKIPVIGRANDPPPSLRNNLGILRPRLPKPSSNSSTSHALSNNAISRRKSLSHENLRTSSVSSHSMISTSSSTASNKTSPVSSRAASPNDAQLRFGKMRPQTTQTENSKTSSCSSSPSSSRCNSPISAGDSRNRRPGSNTATATSSPSGSRCSSPGREDISSDSSQRGTSNANNNSVDVSRRTVQMVANNNGKVKGSKLPLPTSKK